jgi:hypothetical protein
MTDPSDPTEARTGRRPDPGGDRARRAVEGGLPRFVLLHGVLGWGIPTGLLFVLLTWIIQGRPEDLAAFLAVNAVIWPAGGLGFGLLMWRRQVRRAAR